MALAREGERKKEKLGLVNLWFKKSVEIHVKHVYT
jgi:hypothetical protein